MITGRTYLDHGRPVVVLAQWAHSTGIPVPGVLTARTAPRNVLVQREDGTRTVRPFRGLRRPS